MIMHIFIKSLHTLNIVPYNMVKNIFMYKTLSAGLLVTCAQVINSCMFDSK